jgi:hypothetical protein
MKELNDSKIQKILGASTKWEEFRIARANEVDRYY